MFKQLRSPSFSLQLMLPVIAFFPYLIFFFVDIPEPIKHNAQGWIYHTWYIGIGHKPWLFLILGWLFNLVTAYSIYWLNIRFEIIGKRTVYVSFLYCLMILSPLGFHSFHPGMFGGMFILFSLIFIFLIYHSKQTQAYIFNAGFFWGMAVIIYPPFILLFPLYVLSARYVKSTRLKDFILLFTGLIVPILIWGAIIFLRGDFHFQWLSVLQWAEIRKTWPPSLPGRTLLWYLFFGYIFLILIFNANQYRVKKDVGRRVLTIMGQMIWLCPLIFLVFERVSIEILWLAIVPLTFLFSVAAFNIKNQWKSDLVFFGFLIFMIVFQLNLVL